MTSKATIGSAAKERNGLNPKDFVFIAVFGILLFLVFMVFSIIFSANANLCWFTHTVGALFAGTVFMYLAYRVPKRGAIAIMGVIVGAVGLLMGMFWSGPVGIVVGGIVADLIAGDPQKHQGQAYLRLCRVHVLFLAGTDLSHPYDGRGLCRDVRSGRHDPRVRPNARLLDSKPDGRRYRRCHHRWRPRRRLHRYQGVLEALCQAWHVD